MEDRNARILQSGRQKSGNPDSKILAVRKAEREIEKLSRRKGLKMFIKYITKMFLHLIIAVMTLICWFIKIPMMLGNILLYFLSIVFILTGVLSYGFALESASECCRMIIIGMTFGAIPDFVPFLGKSLETVVEKMLSMTNE